jgi:TolB-like protein
MIYRFADCSLDTETFELRVEGRAVPLEPQVFAVLLLLIENRARLVSRDEIIERVWQGRFVSDSAVSSRIKSARKAIGDDGEAQRLIRTVPKLGFRFVGEVKADSPAVREAEAADKRDGPGARPSIAVLPFAVLGEPGPYEWMAEALPYEVLAELARLRWLFVIARGSSFRFRGADVQHVGQALQVRYCLTGVMAFDGARVSVTLELCDAVEGGVIWSEHFRADLDAVHALRERIVASVVSALELEIPAHEAQRAGREAEANLDAWGAYHLGIRQMYRFSPDGNAQAKALFERALELEDGFARARAGLSFTHFENAFLSFTEDVESQAALARRFAERAVDDDPLDPFCNLVMGRTFWLDGDLERSLPWLDRSIRLSPNYAQAKYARGWTETLLGEGDDGRRNVETALQLSPLDPLVYGMLGVKSFAAMVQDQPGEAALWGERAARAPGAHALIEMLAAVAHGLNGEKAAAQAWARSARRRRPGLSSGHFLAAFPFRDEAVRGRIAGVIDSLGG